MKKTISLLITFLMILSIGMLPTYASTDTELAVTTPEASLSLAALANKPDGTGNTNANGFAGTVATLTGTEADAYNEAHTSGVTIVEESGNKMFAIHADTTGGYFDHKLELWLGGYKDAQVKRFSAKVKLPDVTTEGARTTLFKLFNTSAVATNVSNDTVGVVLKEGKAFYYDRATEGYVSFLNAGESIKANEWYTVEAIIDGRAATGDESSRIYMNAFVYDKTGALIGKSGWQDVSDFKLQSSWGWKSALGAQIAVDGYAENALVYVDDFKAYKVEDAPSYSIANNETATKTNKYIGVSNFTNTHRTIGEVFNYHGTQVKISDQATCTAKAARIEIDVRFPDLTTTHQYNIFKFHSGRTGVGATASGTSAYQGAVNIKDGVLQVRSYNSTTSKHDTPVTLSNDSTSYAINANQWYTLVWDIDYTTYDAPMGYVTVKDSSGNTLVTTKEKYAEEKMPWNSTYSQYTSSISYCSSTYSTGKYDVDNTNIYTATAYADLGNTASRTTYLEETFEDSALDTVYNTVATSHITGDKGGITNNCPVAKVVSENVASFTFHDGVELPATKPISLKVTYDNPVPVANITAENIKLLAGGTELVGSSYYTVTPGEADANGNTTTFVIDITGITSNTDYTLRLMADLSDYNATAASKAGIPAEAGVYKDYTFSTPNDAQASVITPLIVDGTGEAVSALTNGTTIYGKATIENNNPSASITGYAILAVYEGTQLKGIKISEPVTVTAGLEGSVTTAEGITLSKDGLTAKVFVWSDLTLIKPLVGPKVLPEVQ